MGHINNDITFLKELLCLEQAVRHGSISKAALSNNIKQPNFSSKIKDLEEELGQPLLIRHSKGVAPTDMGYTYFQMACDIKKIINLRENLSHHCAQLSGSLKLWISDGLGLDILSNCFKNFYQKYPKINVEINCSLDMPKLEEFDMALVFQKPTIKSLDIKNEYYLNFVPFASKEYIALHGVPKDINDLICNHKIVNKRIYEAYSKEWAEVIERSQGVTSITNSSAILANLIKDGIGIGLMPDSMMRKEKNLVSLDFLDISFRLSFWLVVQRQTENIEKIKAFTKIIEQESAKL